MQTENAAYPLETLEVLHLRDMQGQPKEDRGTDPAQTRIHVLLWVSGAWVLPLLGIAFGFSSFTCGQGGACHSCRPRGAPSRSSIHGPATTAADRLCGEG